MKYLARGRFSGRYIQAYSFGKRAILEWTKDKDKAERFSASEVMALPPWTDMEVVPLIGE